MRGIPLLFAIGIVHHAWTATPEEQARSASIYVEARQFDRAGEMYRSLFDTQLPKWQQSIVLYNSGVVLLLQQRWEEAIKAFDAVPISAESSPVLLRRYYYDLAVALLGYAQSQEGLYSTDDPSFLDRFRSLRAILERAVVSLKAAEEADCQLVRIEGAQTCDLPVVNSAVRERIKELLALLDTDEREYQALQLSVGLRLAYLLVAFGEEERWLDRLSRFSNHEAMLMVEEGRLISLQPWWDSLHFEAFSDEEHRFASLAYDAYHKGLLALPKEGALAARQNLRLGDYWLRTALQMASGDGMVALLKVRVLADTLGDPSAAFDAVAQKWLFEQLPVVEAKNPALSKEISKQWRDPQQTLLLYRLAVDDVGAILADAYDNPKTVAQLQVTSGFVKWSEEQAKILESAIKAQPNEVPALLQNLAANSDPVGFLRERLVQIIVRYSLALAHRDLQAASFSQLGPVLEQLKHFIELPEEDKIAGVQPARDLVRPVLSETLGLAMTYHTFGTKALDAQKTAVARIFFGEALYWLMEAQKRSLGESTSSPERLLTAALDEQRHAMQIVSSVMELPATERQASSGYAASLHEAMRRAQEQPTVWAAPFVRTVLQQQEKAFHALGGDDLTCQKYPWEEVMPLYFLGEAASERAAQNLAQSTSSLSDVLTDQKVAYRKWVKALELLREKKAANPIKKSEGASHNKEESVPGISTQNPSIEDILRLLQRMDRDDRKEIPRPQHVPTEGGKPW